METPAILIHERRPRWVPELERQFYGLEVRVRACATIKDLEERLSLAPRAVCLLELEAGPPDCLETLRRLNTRRPSPTIIVTAASLFRELEWSVRELGVLAFLEEPIAPDEMAAWCRRQFQINQSS